MVNVTRRRPRHRPHSRVPTVIKTLVGCVVVLVGLMGWLIMPQYDVSQDVLPQLLLSTTRSNTTQLNPTIPNVSLTSPNNNSNNKNMSTSFQNEAIIKYGPDHPLARLTLPRPIFIPSLPKSGTTSLHRYFVCGGIWSAHTFCNTADKKRQLRIGQCVHENLQKRRELQREQARQHNNNHTNISPFRNCGHYHVWSDAGWPHGCFYPSMDRSTLEALVDAHPQFTLLYVQRNATAWFQSLRNWNGGDLLRKWTTKCPHLFPKMSTQRTVTSSHSNNNNRKKKNQTFDSVPNVDATAWIQFYEQHGQMLRQFAQEHASVVTWVELDLETPNIAQQLELWTGINATQCWKHHNSRDKRFRLNPKYRQEAIDLGILSSNDTS